MSNDNNTEDQGASNQMSSGEFVKLIERQKEIAIQIENKRISAVKYGTKRTRDIYLKIWNEIQELWTEFLTNDLLLNEGVDKNAELLQQPYFAQKKKSIVEAIYSKAVSFIVSHYPDIDVLFGSKKQESADDKNTSDVEVSVLKDIEDHTTMSWANEVAAEVLSKEGAKTAVGAEEHYHTKQSAAADLALLQISEVLKTQQTFQKQIQEQMVTLMTTNRDHRQREGLKAPRVEIPTFSGSLTTYKSFKDTFLTVTENSGISKIEKLTLLKSKVSDIAEEYISHVTIAEDNYDKAWKILDDRFDDPVAIISNCVDKILDMPAIPPNDVRAVEKALNLIQGVGNNLELLGLDANQVVMVRAIIRKLSDDASGELTRFVGNHKEFPSFEKLIKFFIHHLSILRARVPKTSSVVESASRTEQERDRQMKPKSMNRQPPIRSHATVTSDGSSYRCYICFEPHLAPACPKLSAAAKPYELLRHYNLCPKCASHKFNKRKPCIRSISCEVCKQDHLTVLHGKQPQGFGNERPRQPAAQSYFCSSGQSNPEPTSILLPTAVTRIFGKYFNIEKRVLIDVCSQASYVEEQTVQVLKLKKTRCNIDISGVGGELTGKVKSMTKIKFEVNYPERRILEVDAYVVKRVTRKLPAVPSNLRELSGFDKPLADSYCGQPSHVPILLGANIAAELFLDGIFVHRGILMQNTRFGWIVMGSDGENKINPRSLVSTHVSLAEDQTMKNFENDLKQFWDIPVTKEDTEIVESFFCESLFQAKYHQKVDGHYVVPIPWKQEAATLGNSYNFALSCFLAQERRLQKNATHKKMSDEFKQEYIALGHMSPVPEESYGVTKGDVYYIPYHSILRQDSVTTKLRNVFNASAKTSTGISLNQIIHPGPKLQTTIFDVITRIRQYKFIYSSDITKMYRQILLLENDAARLRILYRESRDVPLREYVLNTVTYGIDCAPWQAIRTIHQVGKDYAPNDEILNIITNSFYMDDLFHGADSIEECQHQISQLIEVLNKGQLPLTKWMSNHPDVLTNIEDSKKLESYVELKPESASIKTLGIQYFPQQDLFGYTVKTFSDLKFTKRGMLSVTASLYDPLGWILPVIMKFRILIQKLWSMELDWDEVIELKLKEQFQKFIESLPALHQLRIPRWMGTFNFEQVDLVGFSDASGDGFAAVLYSRLKTNDSYIITLIASRGRVTPLKTKKNLDSKLCTIPKMELEGLCLLVELFKDVSHNFPSLQLKLNAYTDSQVVIAWIRSTEEIENKFVRRRVRKVRKVLAPADVHYVKSIENPADAASRGQSAEEFMSKIQLWSEGPAWMKFEVLPTTPFEKSQITISNATVNSQQLSNEDFIAETILRFSSLDKLIGCVSLILMWVQMFRKKCNKPEKSGQITKESRRKIIRLQQHHSFENEINSIRKGEQLRKGHWMSYLSPFLDEDGILRVGGRLDRANVPRNQKHPMLIPKCHLAKLIIRDVHLKNMHAPNALTDRLVKESYWIPGSRNLIRQEIHRCTLCQRFCKQVNQPQMSDLPVERLHNSAIFECTSVDFAGPFSVRASKVKFDRRIKVWVAVFVCMATKLSHLELCTELSADNFLAAFDRFTSRRSTPGKIVSDNGTNFVSANKILAQQFKSMLEKGASILATREIEWKFIPPGSPHFGGLHEACVKSFKYFVKRMAHVENLLYEEFHTLICKIEGILNSRPLYPLSTDPNDELALTPGHFAVQRCLQAPPFLVSSSKQIPIWEESSSIDGANFNNIEGLSPGIHILNLGEVNVKSLNVLFSLQTSVNVTEDLQILDDQLAKFKGFCTSIRQLSNSNVTKLCSERSKFLEQEVDLTKANILGSYGAPRQTRSLSMLSKLTFGGLLKKGGPYAAMAATIGWQEYENWKTTQKLHAVEDKFNKVSFILLNITETETTALQDQLDNLVTQQKQLILETEINGFVSSVQSLIDTIETRHQSLINIRPNEELEDYVKTLNYRAEIVRVPVLPDQVNLFAFHPIKKYIKDGSAVLQYDVVLVQPEHFQKYVVVSVPENDANETVILDNGNIIQMIISNNANSSYFYPETATEIFPHIFDNVKMQTHPTCTLGLLQQKDDRRDCHRGLWSNTLKFFPISATQVIIMRPNGEDISINCDQVEKVLSDRVSLLNSHNCYVPEINISESFSLDVAVAEKIKQQSLTDGFEPIHIEQNTVRSIEQTVNGLKKELNDTVSKNVTNWSPELIGCISCLIFSVFCILGFYSCQHRTGTTARNIARESWTANLEG